MRDPTSTEILILDTWFLNRKPCKIVDRLKISEGNCLNSNFRQNLSYTKFRQHQYLKVWRRSENWSERVWKFFMRYQTYLDILFIWRNISFTFKDISDIDIPVILLEVWYEMFQLNKNWLTRARNRVLHIRFIATKLAELKGLCTYFMNRMHFRISHKATNFEF